MTILQMIGTYNLFGIESLKWEAQEGSHYTFLVGSIVNDECRRSWPYEFGFWQNGHNTPQVGQLLEELRDEGKMLRESPTVQDFCLVMGYDYSLARDLHRLMRDRRSQLVKLIGKGGYNALVRG